MGGGAAGPAAPPADYVLIFTLVDEKDFPSIVHVAWIHLAFSKEPFAAFMVIVLAESFEVFFGVSRDEGVAAREAGVPVEEPAEGAEGDPE